MLSSSLFTEMTDGGGVFTLLWGHSRGLYFSQEREKLQSSRARGRLVLPPNRLPPVPGNSPILVYTSAVRNGASHDRKFSQAIQAGADRPAGPAAVKLHEESTEPILILGDLVRDCGVVKDLLSGLAFTSKEEYTRNLCVVRGAAERMMKRCDRLIGE